MKLNKNANIFYKDNNENMLRNTTDLCFAAHHDDIEIMAYGVISKCYNNDENWFTGVVITDGAGSPRSGDYKNVTNEDMKKIRLEEQKNASIIGDYAAQICLGYPSELVISKNRSELIKDIIKIIKATKPINIYIHNLADKHKTHVATAIAVLDALKQLPEKDRPQKVYALEVWRGLDWVCDNQKICFDTSDNLPLQEDLIKAHKSQMDGGKRYDRAAIGRRFANATFFESHDIDDCDSMSYAIDMTKLVKEDISYIDFINEFIDSFKKEINTMLNALK